MRAFRIPARYVSSHWHGRQPLAWSFWINLVALRVLIFTLQSRFVPQEGEDYSHLRVPVYGVVLAIHLVLLGWQLVGVIRAADRHFSEHGNMALVWGTQLGATLAFILTAVHGLGAVQMTYRLDPADTAQAVVIPAVSRNYTIALSPSGRQLSIEGDIESGITRTVRQILLANPSIEQVRLDSAGGNIFEARGLHRLFATYRLNTHVDGRCASACTTAYAGGLARSASPEAVFGFHQYRMDSPQVSLVTSAVDEQSNDERLFLEAGVSKAFVVRMFDSKPQEMWWPSAEDLRLNGVVHEFR